MSPLDPGSVGDCRKSPGKVSTLRLRECFSSISSKSGMREKNRTWLFGSPFDVAANKVPSENNRKVLNYEKKTEGVIRSNFIRLAIVFYVRIQVEIEDCALCRISHL